MTPGYYMPNLYYGQQTVTQPVGVQQQSYAPQPQQTNHQMGMIWVDGEVGAKAFQMPQGWPFGTPIPLWDTNDTVIYLKSINQMGMPNPLQKIHYTMDENKNLSALPAGQMSGAPAQEMPNYVTREDLDRKIEEVKEMLKQVQNRGGQA